MKTQRLAKIYGISHVSLKGQSHQFLGSFLACMDRSGLGKEHLPGTGFIFYFLKAPPNLIHPFFWFLKRLIPKQIRDFLVIKMKQIANKD